MVIGLYFQKEFWNFTLFTFWGCVTVWYRTNTVLHTVNVDQVRPLRVDSLNLRIKRCTQKTSGRKKIIVPYLCYYKPTDCRKFRVKNQPFKEPTYGGLMLYLSAENFQKISGTHFNPAFQLARALSLMEIYENFLHMNCLRASFWKMSPSTVIRIFYSSTWRDFSDLVPICTDWCLNLIWLVY